MATPKSIQRISRLISRVGAREIDKDLNGKTEQPDRAGFLTVVSKCLGRSVAPIAFFVYTREAFWFDPNTDTFVVEFFGGTWSLIAKNVRVALMASPLFVLSVFSLYALILNHRRSRLVMAWGIVLLGLIALNRGTWLFVEIVFDALPGV